MGEPLCGREGKGKRRGRNGRGGARGREGRGYGWLTAYRHFFSTHFEHWVQPALKIAKIWDKCYSPYYIYLFNGRTISRWRNQMEVRSK